MGLCDSSDGWIAGHSGDSLPFHGDECHLASHPGGCQRCLAPGVTCSHNNDIITGQENASLPNTESRENALQQFLMIDPSRDFSEHLKG